MCQNGLSIEQMVLELEKDTEDPVSKIVNIKSPEQVENKRQLRPKICQPTIVPPTLEPQNPIMNAASCQNTELSEKIPMLHSETHVVANDKKQIARTVVKEPKTVAKSKLAKSKKILAKLAKRMDCESNKKAKSKKPLVVVQNINSPSRKRENSAKEKIKQATEGEILLTEPHQVLPIHFIFVIYR